MEPIAGTCGWCGEPLDGRADKAYCNSSCRRQARRKRQRNRERSSYLSSSGGSSGFSPDDRARWAEADARFNAMVSPAAGDQRRALGQQEREWAAYERRHGTAHPGRERARLERGRQARADDWEQGTAHFLRASGTIAERGRAQRQLQARPVHDPMPQHYDNDGDDPDLWEPPQMIDMGNWRRGRTW
jgi:hypothetical protein